MLRASFAAVVALSIVTSIGAQTGAPGCCFTPPPAVTVNLTGVSLYISSPGILTFTANVTLPSDAYYVTATLLKNTFAYAAPCSGTSKIANGGFLFTQPAATGMTVQPVFPTQGREMSWTKTGVSTPVTVTLPMNIILQPYWGATCSSGNPTRVAEVCVVYRVYSRVPCGGITMCSMCQIVKTFTVKWNNTTVLSSGTAASCT